MARGGARPGAGRPKGVSPKKTQALRDAVAKGGITPLDYLLSVMRNKKGDPEMRLDAAKAAAQYVHPKLAAVELSGDRNAPVALTLMGSDVSG
jgi:hypothetical protein